MIKGSLDFGRLFLVSEPVILFSCFKTCFEERAYVILKSIFRFHKSVHNLMIVIIAILKIEKLLLTSV